MGRAQTAKRDPTKELQRTTNQIVMIIVENERRIGKIINKVVELVEEKIKEKIN